ncbi:single-stranded DNA-binding protein [Nostocoides sp. HKS02]|uniref:single-stranded DNA-binding protein n=1 Tax=Nostocoides sp. HKS02 TaxID=1813880 RepID=UPI0012B4CC88|nr:single-stranded DNA-binding protein [Tetrasphaera sp. HKS02]QGN57310.1 single-stranded DNA-binding protein [Tetrasphaera sp. HKS02]
MEDSGEWANEVRLVGRVSAAAEERELPSGDLMVALRVVVPRSGGGTSSTRVDTVDVACWSARTRRSARNLEPGARIEVRGALRRRFYRAGAATLSRYEVEATSVSRLRRHAALAASRNLVPTADQT